MRDDFSLQRAMEILVETKDRDDWVLIDVPGRGLFAVEPRPDPINGEILSCHLDSDNMELEWVEAGVGLPLQEYDLLMKRLFLTGSL